MIICKANTIAEEAFSLPGQTNIGTNTYGDVDGLYGDMTDSQSKANGDNAIDDIKHDVQDTLVGVTNSFAVERTDCTPNVTWLNENGINIK